MDHRWMVSSCAGLTPEQWPSATTCPTESWWGPSRCTTTSHTLPLPAWCWRTGPPSRTSMSLSWLQDSPTGKAQTRVTLQACSPPQRGTQYWAIANQRGTCRYHSFLSSGTVFVQIMTFVFVSKRFGLVIFSHALWNDRGSDRECGIS